MEEHEREYRNYLISTVERRGEDYQFLLEVLWKTEFYPLIPHDQNREYDGLALREEVGIDPNTFGPCRVLEALIGIARRYEFELSDGFNPNKPNIFTLDVAPPVEDLGSDGSKTRTDLFWLLVENLGLMQYSRRNWKNTHVLVEIDEILHRWLSRGFRRNGEGSPFPLRYPRKDMRNVDIWYQLEAYIMERHK